MQKKILDSALWISIAAIFYFWSLLFFFVLYFALLRKPYTNYKEFVIPIMGFLGICFVTTTFYLFTTDSLSWFYEWNAEFGVDFLAYNEVKLLVPLSCMGAFLIWTGVSRLLTLSSLKSKEKPNAEILIFSVGITIIMVLGSLQKTGAELLFTLGPLAIISANYIETDLEFWFKESLLWLVVLLPLAVIFL